MDDKAIVVMIEKDWPENAVEALRKMNDLVDRMRQRMMDQQVEIRVLEEKLKLMSPPQRVVRYPKPGEEYRLSEQAKPRADRKYPHETDGSFEARMKAAQA